MAKLKRNDYEKLIAPMQLELNNLAHWLRHTGKRMVVLFEGRDTAGKGGTINTIAETLNAIAGDKSSTIVFPLPVDLYQALTRGAAKTG